jgi:hypothetical protein
MREHNATQRETQRGPKMTIAAIEAERLNVAVAVVKRLGKYRALEAGSPNVPPTPNPLGEGFTGVDLDGSTFRARIGVAVALDGVQKRITLGRSKNADDAAWMYRVAHVALYGSYSWAADSLSDSEKTLIELTRNAVLNG